MIYENRIVIETSTKNRERFFYALKRIFHRSLKMELGVNYMERDSITKEEAFLNFLERLANTLDPPNL